MLRATALKSFRAAVLLHGNGVYDGTETTEGVALLVALSRQKATVQCYAQDINQAHVVKHTDGSEDTATRNVLEESARIARGDVKDMATLDASSYDALFIPGGFGAAKNLSDFAFKGADTTVAPEVADTLKAFHAQQKYIGLCCIAPVLAARVFGTSSGGPGVHLTLGSKGDDWPFAGAIDAAESWGNTVTECDTTEGAVVHDTENRIVTTPAYMKGTAQPHEVFDSVCSMVATVAKSI